jgi:hypothetical protein
MIAREGGGAPARKATAPPLLMGRAVAAAEFLQDETSLIRTPIRFKDYACTDNNKSSQRHRD